ncbi:hypothetical protein E1A91_A05G358300v1 [Gossypium mustelinum]|uniref:Uncharacterized protein n=1 Tax=Gossypium mustelinum TaxID=34275 RepID=A0A5D2ZG73_GOSMU|nr:hypothetical protein E1A91_A05G358300v1 [Gossypium mustelinum]
MTLYTLLLFYPSIISVRLSWPFHFRLVFSIIRGLIKQQCL